MLKNLKTGIIVSLILLIIIVIVVLKIKSSDAPQRRTSIPVVVPGNLLKGEIINSESLTGDILPIQQANIFTKVSGNIENIYVDIGDPVKQNQVLALIDTTIYAQNMKQAKANYMQALANLENNKLIYDRNRKLLDQNLIAKQDLDNAKTSLDVATAQKEAAYAAYTNALTQLGYCKITAPFSGSITKRMFDPGTYVSASGSSQGSILFTLMNVNELKSIVNVPEKDIPMLNKIQSIEVIPDALPGKIFKAKLKKISGAVDLNTRTMAVEVDIENPGKVLKPGMFAAINLILEKKENSDFLPNQVVLNDDGGDYVYLLNPDSTVSKKYVQLGIQQNNKSEILSGLNASDKIVFVGQELIRDRMKVRVAK
jgi:membrane fusion protein (multidrug efflux system)